jgi:hypothetical protein
MSRVSETLVAWREAQRRLETAEDPDEIPALTAEAHAFTRRIGTHLLRQPRR